MIDDVRSPDRAIPAKGSSCPDAVHAGLPEKDALYPPNTQYTRPLKDSLLPS